MLAQEQGMQQQARPDDKGHTIHGMGGSATNILQLLYESQSSNNGFAYR
jgi:hypothetical protein